jgi:glycosyltransferase involved in cell wall biosynthesis
VETLVNSRYVLITPARNEEQCIENTIQSVISQTVAPLRWIIVSDGSTDRTDEIVKRYLNDHPFIVLHRRKGDVQRNFSSQVFAFNTGYEKLQGLNYDFIGNLDADVSFQPDYYEAVLERFSHNPRLGLAGGYIYEKQKGQFKSRPGNRTYSVAHAIQLFRRSCFEEVGGYTPLKYGGSDWHAQVMAILKDWEVQAFTDLPVYHHKPTLTAEGNLNGGFRQGRMDYTLGSSPFFEILKCLSRINMKPYGLYSAYRFAGFLRGYIEREERPVSKDFMKFLRKKQFEKTINAISILFRK